MMDVFACQHCAAMPEMIIDGRAQLSIVRHSLGCPTLLTQVRTRWPIEAEKLPETPGQVPFAKRADFGRFRKAVLARERKRQPAAAR
ncbi:hypothetical protein MSM1_15620 [Mycobacterium sp. SM1]|uniref:hypothetical protein n=1 Tax=Mycobacterium sp. SM1 TaxID=2816243 RepID=UPI001BCDD449|nr:hypothetical protein [Mycobacterium sp. SM1]MBS4729710.1 hypothetical protein [Mycobacterium sp. SM1]